MDRAPSTVELTASRGRVTLRLHAHRVGEDLSVTLGGGDRAHIGAVAVSQPRPSLQPDRGRSATTSVIALLGHKEDELARRTAARLASTLGAVACVACGVHVDRIEPAEIADVEALADQLVTELLRRLTTG
jgi:hypothetical protein